MNIFASLKKLKYKVTTADTTSNNPIILSILAPFI